MLAVILTEQLCNKIQPDKIKMAASLENTAIVIAPLIPWSIAGAVPVATIGAPESCVVAAVYLWMLPIWGILVEKVLRKTYRQFPKLIIRNSPQICDEFAKIKGMVLTGMVKSPYQNSR